MAKPDQYNIYTIATTVPPSALGEEKEYICKLHLE